MLDALKITGEFFASGVGVFALTHMAKKLSFIPLQEGQTVKLRLFAGLLSAVGVVGVSMANGSVGTEDVKSVIMASMGLVFTWLTSHTAHKMFTAK